MFELCCVDFVTWVKSENQFKFDKRTMFEENLQNHEEKHYLCFFRVSKLFSINWIDLNGSSIVQYIIVQK